MLYLNSYIIRLFMYFSSILFSFLMFCLASCETPTDHNRIPGDIPPPENVPSEALIKIYNDLKNQTDPVLTLNIQMETAHLDEDAKKKFFLNKLGEIKKITGDEKICPALLYTKNLEKLHINLVDQVEPSGCLQAIFKIISLRDLKLEHWPDMKLVPKGLEKLTNLEKLDFHGSGRGQMAIDSHSITLLNKLTHLNKLDFSYALPPLAFETEMLLKDLTQANLEISPNPWSRESSALQLVVKSIPGQSLSGNFFSLDSKTQVTQLKNILETIKPKKLSVEVVDRYMSYPSQLFDVAPYLTTVEEIVWHLTDASPRRTDHIGGPLDEGNYKTFSTENLQLQRLVEGFARFPALTKFTVQGDFDNAHPIGGVGSEVKNASRQNISFVYIK